MYNELTKKLYASQGYLKTDAADEYLKDATSYEFPKFEFQEAVVTLLDDLIKEKHSVEIIPKSRWTGMSSNSFVFKVTLDKKVLYFKLTKSFHHQIGSLLSNAYFKDNPRTDLTTPEILEHGCLDYRERQRLYFTLITQAKGCDLFSSLKEENHPKFLHFVNFIGNMIGSFHNNKTTPLTDYDKLLVATRINDEITHEALILPVTIKMGTNHKTYNNFIEKIFPELYRSKGNYLQSSQKKTFGITALKLTNLTFDKEEGVLTIFDTTKLTPFCGPSSMPQWAGEFNFCSFLHHIKVIGTYFDFSKSRIQECEDAFLESYYNTCKKKIMTFEGVDMFMTQAHVRSIKNLLKDTTTTPGSMDKAKHLIDQYEEFKNKKDVAIAKILNQSTSF